MKNCRKFSMEVAHNGYLVRVEPGDGSRPGLFVFEDIEDFQKWYAEALAMPDQVYRFIDALGQDSQKKQT